MVEKKKPFKLIVSPDRLEVSLHFLDDYAKHQTVSRASIQSELKARRIIYGIDLSALDAWLADRTKVDKLVLARGKPPIHGRDAQIDLCATLNSPEFEPMTVLAQDLLAVVLPPTVGVPGVDVFGKKAQAEIGKESNLTCGANVIARESGPNTEYCAQVAGLPTLVAGYRLSVFRKVDIQSDVDSMVGDLIVDGSLVVAGNIRSQVVVRVSGDLFCYGHIEGATVITGGNLTVRGGIVGNHDCQIVASGCVRSAFVENADVAAKGDIIVQGGLVRSTITSQSNIIAQSEAGRLVGCQTAAHKTILVSELGSQAEIPTRVAVGKKACQRMRNKTQSNRAKMLMRGLHANLESNSRKSSDSQRAQAVRLKAQIRTTTKTTAGLRTGCLKQEKDQPQIEVRDRTFPAVTMIIKGVGKFIDQKIEGHCLFFYDPQKDYVRRRSLPNPESKVAEEHDNGSEQKKSN